MKYWEEEQALLNAVVDWHPEKRGIARRNIGYHRFVGWFTTAPHPTRPAHTHGADQGQVGWKLHLIQGDHKRLGDRWYAAPAALCGLRPKHGWGMDLFIDAPCHRCLRQAIKRKLTLPELPD